MVSQSTPRYENVAEKRRRERLASAAAPATAAVAPTSDRFTFDSSSAIPGAQPKLKRASMQSGQISGVDDSNAAEARLETILMSRLRVIELLLAQKETEITNLKDEIVAKNEEVRRSLTSCTHSPTHPLGTNRHHNPDNPYTHDTLPLTCRLRRRTNISRDSKRRWE